MIKPDNLVYYDKENISNTIQIDFNNLPIYDKEEYNLLDEKSFKKFMSDIEKNVRDSYEYKYKLIPFLKQYMGLNECSFFKNINNVDMSHVRIELHHSPFTLYDICSIVYNKRSYYNQSVDVVSIAEEVCLLHYCGLVGLIPLSETVHELVHNGYIFIPTTAVFGRYKEFAKIYEPFLGDLKDTLNRIEEYTEVYNNEQAKYLLSRKYTYIEPIGEFVLPQTKQIYQLAQNNINKIKYGLEDKGYNKNIVDNL